MRRPAESEVSLEVAAAPYHSETMKSQVIAEIFTLGGVCRRVEPFSRFYSGGRVVFSLESVGGARRLGAASSSAVLLRSPSSRSFFSLRKKFQSTSDAPSPAVSEGPKETQTAAIPPSLHASSATGGGDGSASASAKPRLFFFMRPRDSASSSSEFSPKKTRESETTSFVASQTESSPSAEPQPKRITPFFGCKKAVQSPPQSSDATASPAQSAKKAETRRPTPIRTRLRWFTAGFFSASCGAVWLLSESLERESDLRALADLSALERRLDAVEARLGSEEAARELP